MKFSEYQKKAKETAIYPELIQIDNKFARNIYYPALGLAGEAGELCNKIKKIMRDDNGLLLKEKRKDLSKEIGDVLWYVSALATDLSLDLDQIAQENIDKLFNRKERNVLGGDGDNR